MIDNAADAKRFHLIDAPKSLVSSFVKSDADDKGQDGGEKIKDIYLSAGTLFLFDSVFLPHEVLQTNRERFGKRPHGSKLPLKENASRRSVTWLVYLTDDWDPEQDGGQLSLHEREYESVFPVGAAIRNDLQVGWLKANPSKGLGEQPVFLDPNRDGPENETCVLYTFEKDGRKRDLSKAPFANLALYLGGGDAVARKLMIDNAADAKRFHLIDAPKSLVSSFVKSDANDKGQDGGEKIKDIYLSAGTLFLFDSVFLPHEVLQTNRERFGVQGEKFLILCDYLMKYCRRVGNNSEWLGLGLGK
ncbi:hypothetical protein CTEN210_11709 [Chaetoceros tenuissimus]|uniref:Uncharacterized protein n=1 Tax=Chaetoceros tenuissimus TaxID=426638 RepID=A0AAD3H9T1_9STRA|nr:hypothetical protein CTEN210_11709 [Chaetoceros tenuissimus]